MQTINDKQIVCRTICRTLLVILAYLLIFAITTIVPIANSQTTPKFLLSQDCIQKVIDAIEFSSFPIVASGGWIFRSFSHLSTHPKQNSYFTKLLQSFSNNNIELSMVVLPQRSSVSLNYLLASVEGFDINKTKLNYDNVIKDLQELEVFAPNILDIAEDLALSEESFYLPQDSHWTNLGAELTANFLAKSIPTRLIGSENIEIVEQGTIEYTGNLAKALIEACPEFNFEVHKYNIKNISAQSTGLDLFDDTSKQTVLLGTSYSAGSQWGFQAYLEKALLQSIATFAVSGGGAWQSITTYLASSAFEANTPQHIIWEIPLSILNAMLADRPENEAYYQQLFGVLNGQCLSNTAEKTFHNINSLSLPVEDTHQRYLKVKLNDLSVKSFSLLGISNSGNYDVDIVRSDRAQNHGNFYYEMPKIEGLLSIELTFPKTVVDVSVVVCQQ